MEEEQRKPYESCLKARACAARKSGRKALRYAQVKQWSGKGVVWVTAVSSGLGAALALADAGKYAVAAAAGLAAALTVLSCEIKFFAEAEQDFLAANAYSVLADDFERLYLRLPKLDIQDAD